MKKTLLFFAAVLITLPQVEAQDASSKVMHKGMNSVNLYYGVSISKSLYKAVASNSATDLRVSGLGPVGIVYEHMISDVVGLGVEFGYAQTIVSYVMQDTYYYNGSTQLSSYSYEWKFTTIRAMMRCNLHFLDNENFDMYGLISGGYRGTSYSFTTSDPSGKTNATYDPIFPFGIKLGLGMRYFFTDNLGIQTEFALGTPLLSGGLCFKF
jgi:hypothetical protein